MADKVAITGASSGIGQAAALAFAEEGYDLFLVARREDRLSDVARQCEQAGSRRTGFAALDLSLEGNGTKAVGLALEHLGGLDVLICNAGYGYWGALSEVPPKDMARMWQVNFQSAYESVYAALPHFKERRSGHIMLVSSIIGKKAMPFSAAYCATKFAQAGLGDSLWGELRSQGINVTVVCPGFTATEFQEVATPLDRARPRRPIRGQHPRVVARAMLKAVRSKKKEVHLTLSGKAILLINRFSSTLASHIMRVVAAREFGSN